MVHPLPRYAVVLKQIGETPLQALERYRTNNNINCEVPLTYAGRLDPLASGVLLILIGDECKQQANYHGLDKAYRFSVLFGVGSDTYDPLGRLTMTEPPTLTKDQLLSSSQNLVGDINLPYPPFSAKTVRGKPLHTWTLEGRLDEIDIPYKRSTVFKLQLEDMHYVSGTDIYNSVCQRINAVTPVTDERKALGKDFRRVDVQADWETFRTRYAATTFPIADFVCIASSGTYMRALAHNLGEQLGTAALAFTIFRTTIGHYQPETQTWRTVFNVS